LKLSETPLPGVLLVEPQVFRDERGFFLEVWNAGKFAAQGLDVAFVQDNHSQSQQGTLRGLHVQLPNSQGKLVRCTEGEIFDVAVDIRRGSPTFAQWYGVVLSAANFRQLWVPPDFAHGFCVLSERAQVEYKCTDALRPGRRPVDRLGRPGDRHRVAARHAAALGQGQECPAPRRAHRPVAAVPRLNPSRCPILRF
jgi:dTDP-4-dehydrorhamnose 3,5-epimerase